MKNSSWILSLALLVGTTGLGQAALAEDLNELSGASRGLIAIGSGNGNSTTVVSFSTQYHHLLTRTLQLGGDFSFGSLSGSGASANSFAITV